jgi:hypothetical protein
MDYSYDLEELADYYLEYDRLMRHWEQVLPGKILTVHYEDTVLDLEGQVRRILEHCGLPFEEACLRYHENPRTVRTASSEQVRRPIYTESLGTWRRYEKHLGLWQQELTGIIAALPRSACAMWASSAQGTLNRKARPRAHGSRCGCRASGSLTTASRYP